MKILIKNGIIIDKSYDHEKMDILIDEGKITAIKQNIQGQDANIINAEGLIIMPGLIDMHCHLREPGFEYKEDIYSGTRSAARGGFTKVACMPNTNPVIDNPSIIQHIKYIAQSKGVVDVLPIGSITKGLEGKELSDMADMQIAGAVAVSDDGNPVMDSSLMIKALKYAHTFNIPVISHCEDLTLVGDGVMNEGYQSTVTGLSGITRAAEDVMVSRDIILAESTKTKVHIAHVSTKGSVELIRRAKERGVNVTCETAPHYFSLTDKAVEGFDTLAKVNPPLRTHEDVNAVKEGLKDGTIDAIATDHAPHHIDEKNVEFNLASNGIVGFETALPLTITHLVSKGVLNWVQMLEKLYYNPSRILGIEAHGIKEGEIADIIILDGEREFKIDVSKFYSKSKNSPFDGHNVIGNVVYTICKGKIIIENAELKEG